MKKQEVIILKFEEAVEIITELDFIVVSLDKMGSYYGARNDFASCDIEFIQFFSKSKVKKRLLNMIDTLEKHMKCELSKEVNKIIIEMCERIPYWNEPGNYYKTLWISDDFEQDFIKSISQNVNIKLEDVLLIYKELKFILISLDNIEKYYISNDISEKNIEITRFLYRSRFAYRIASCRLVLSTYIDQLFDDMDEDKCDEFWENREIQYWRKPGDFNSMC